jgi:hypothetical protein
MVEAVSGVNGKRAMHQSREAAWRYSPHKGSQASPLTMQRFYFVMPIQVGWSFRKGQVEFRDFFRMRVEFIGELVGF